MLLISKKSSIVPQYVYALCKFPQQYNMCFNVSSHKKAPNEILEFVKRAVPNKAHVG